MNIALGKRKASVVMTSASLGRSPKILPNRRALKRDPFEEN